MSERERNIRLLDNWVNRQPGDIIEGQMQHYLRRLGADEIEAVEAVRDYWRRSDAKRDALFARLLGTQR